ncbi:hypothetical protein L3Y34_017387 [Caenorhabditis briggsae]|uniref:Transcription factor AP-2 C-terminal domain-containing protein n=1 Tax=Caenorhabditis briggsae TaxID=6238 RepID=A0AAE9DHB8_CAEBR|nr:hypothetical protein L3Y34_017387 [Caenorhabditis briggsae]
MSFDSSLHTDYSQHYSMPASDAPSTSTPSRKRQAPRGDMENQPKYTLLESAGAKAHAPPPQQYAPENGYMMYNLFQDHFYHNYNNFYMPLDHQNQYFMAPPAREVTPPMAAQQTVPQHSTPTEPAAGSMMYTPESLQNTPVAYEQVSVVPPAPDTYQMSRDTYRQANSEAAVVPATTTTKKFVKKAPKSEPFLLHLWGLKIPAGSAHGNAPQIFPTFSIDHPLNDSQIIVQEVDGRLPIVGSRSKMSLTVGELRRRVGAPENMNMSAMYAYFRKSKKKETMQQVKEILERHQIDIPHMQRKRKFSRFTPMLEEECSRLAEDLSKLYEKYLPEATLAEQMVMDMLGKGCTLDKCLRFLENTKKIMGKIVNTLESRQPALTYHEEKLKNNRLDVFYHVFSLLTHGFGHPVSILHYRHYHKIVVSAIEIAQNMISGTYNLTFEDAGTAKPFAVMSDAKWAEQCARKQAAVLAQAYNNVPV